MKVGIFLAVVCVALAENSSSKSGQHNVESLADRSAQSTGGARILPGFPLISPQHPWNQRSGLQTAAQGTSSAPQKDDTIKSLFSGALPSLNEILGSFSPGVQVSNSPPHQLDDKKPVFAPPSHQLDDKKPVFAPSSHQLDDKRTIFVPSSHQLADHKINFAPPSHQLDDKKIIFAPTSHQVNDQQNIFAHSSHQLDHHKNSFAPSLHQVDDKQIIFAPSSHQLDNRKINFAPSSHQLDDNKHILAHSSHQLDNRKINLAPSSHQLDDNKNILAHASHQLDNKKNIFAPSPRQLDDHKIIFARSPYQPNAKEPIFPRSSHQLDDQKIPYASIHQPTSPPVDLKSRSFSQGDDGSSFIPTINGRHNGFPSTDTPLQSVLQYQFKGRVPPIPAAIPDDLSNQDASSSIPSQDDGLPLVEVGNSVISTGPRYQGQYNNPGPGIPYPKNRYNNNVQSDDSSFEVKHPIFNGIRPIPRFFPGGPVGINRRGVGFQPRLANLPIGARYAPRMSHFHNSPDSSYRSDDYYQSPPLSRHRYGDLPFQHSIHRPATWLPVTRRFLSFPGLFGSLPPVHLNAPVLW